MPTLQVITLGCSKNTVDTEHLLYQVRDLYEIVPEGEVCPVDVQLINTCGFIGDAKEQSIQTILASVQRKKDGEIGRLLVFGCLSQRYTRELPDLIPEVDGWFGARDLDPVVRALGCKPDPASAHRRVRTDGIHLYAYLKISEGCDHQCSYCAIPLIRGKQVSKPIPLLVEEAHKLADQGVKELMLIAQDLTYYGVDLTGKHELAKLMEALAQVKDLEWIRLHYAYPINFPYEILDVMNAYPQYCRYLDIPFQHVSDDILKSMRRGGTSKYIYDLIARIRETVPGIALRTTLISGYPTETNEQHKELVEFVRHNRFERLGVFAYSQEEDTPAYELGDPVRRNIKTRRVNEIMQLQEDISRELNEAKVGQTLKVIIDAEEQDFYVGRTEFDSPDVDNSVLVRKDKALKIGDFYQVKITDAADYDLYGTIEN